MQKKFTGRPSAAEMNKKIEIEVVYALSQQQILLQLSVATGTTAGQAVELSGIGGYFPDTDMAHNKLGIFGKPVKAETVLRDHDRVEIYRPLIADPKEVRRQRAARGKAMKKGGE